jgi:tetratricopeptide (TPR) repeat protein
MELIQIQKEQDCVKEGDLRDSLGRFEDAIASYDRALRMDPGDADAWFNKGTTLTKMGKHAEATQCVETAINLYCGR